MEPEIQFGSEGYYSLLALLIFSRGMDLLSTRLATPNLALEANPIARMMGWKLGTLVNAVMCGVFACMAFPSMIIATCSLLVAARNFQSAWLMRSMGEYSYRRWIAERLSESGYSMYLFCLVAQVVLTSLVGVGLVMYAGNWVILGIGFGVLAYTMALLIFTLLSVWRLWRQSRIFPNE